MSDKKVRANGHGVDLPAPPALDASARNANGIIAARKLYQTDALYAGSYVVYAAMLVLVGTWLWFLNVKESDKWIKVALATPQLTSMIGGVLYAHFLRTQFNAILITKYAANTSLYNTTVRGQVRAHTLMYIGVVFCVGGIVINFAVGWNAALATSDFIMAVALNLVMTILTLLLCVVTRNREDGRDHFMALTKKSVETEDLDSFEPGSAAEAHDD